VEEGVGPDELGVPGQRATALGEQVVEVIEGFDVPIGGGLVNQGPEVFGRLQFGRWSRPQPAVL